LFDILSDMTSAASPLSIRNPATGETYTFLKRAADTGGELLQLRWSAQPGGEVGEHVHPLQQERFEVVSGSLTVSINGQEAVCAAGEAIALAPGVRHYFANRSAEPVSAILEIRPALRMETVFESLAGMAHEGETRSDGLPRNLLQLAVFAWEFRDEIRGPRPPYPIQRMILPVLAALGRRLGYRGHHPHYRADVAGEPA
jgi:quercetin dioxygenase-like cupin family protein